MTSVLAIYAGEMRMMNKEIAQYINDLLADRQRLLDERELGSEDWDSLKEETKSELVKIYHAQKAMDYIIEEEDEDPNSEFDAASYT